MAVGQDDDVRMIIMVMVVMLWLLVKMMMYQLHTVISLQQEVYEAVI